MKISYLIPVFVLSIVSCSKTDEPPPSFNTSYQIRNSPDAKAANDNINFGIYKGVTISALGQSATIKFDIYNSTAEPFALFYRDEKINDSLLRYRTDNLGNLARPTQRETTPILLNGPRYTASFFSYKDGVGPYAWLGLEPFGASGNMGINFDVNATLNAVLKEQSNNQVYCFEGSFSGTDSGRIAMVIRKDSVIAVRASVWHGQFFKPMSAAVAGNQFILNQVDDVYGITHVLKGTFDNEQCTGTWIAVSDSTVINPFRAKRTL